MSEGRLRPELVTDRVLAWNQAPEALADDRGKLVFSRPSREGSSPSAS